MTSLLVMKVQRTANVFRLGMEGKGGQLFSELIDELFNIVLTLPSGESLVNFNTLLQNMIQAQLRADYLYLADLIEYELVNVLSEIDN